MRLFGYDLSFKKAAPPNSRPVDGGDRGWFTLWRSDDHRPGSWQQDERLDDDSLLAQTTLFSCITLIASDAAKLELQIEQRYGKVWLPKTVPGYTDLLKKPNGYQTRQQFIESWQLSKQSRGNTCVLLSRPRRNALPTAMHVLNPDRVTPLVAPNGEVFYQLGEDNLAGVVEDAWTVPASEIIHDRFNCLFHPLVGLSPIFAAGLAATQALRIQESSARFFRNMARPGGMLTAPAKISDETAKRLKAEFEKNFEGENQGRLFVAGDSLSYQALSVNAVDSEVVAQLGVSAKQIAATFHIPPYMVGAAEPPAINNIEAEQQRYYNQCLQTLLQASEACLDRALGLGAPVTLEDGSKVELRTNFNEGDLLRMDSGKLIEVLEKGVKGIMKPDEARERLNLLPVAGGGAVYMQQQNYSLAALDKRDTGEDPFGSGAPAPSQPPPPASDGDASKAAAEALRIARNLETALAQTEAARQAADAAAAEARRDAAAAIERAHAAADAAMARTASTAEQRMQQMLDEAKVARDADAAARDAAAQAAREAEAARTAEAKALADAEEAAARQFAKHLMAEFA